MRQKFSRSTRVVACETTGANCLAESLAAQKLVTWCGTKKTAGQLRIGAITMQIICIYVCMYI